VQQSIELARIPRQTIIFPRLFIHTRTRITVIRYEYENLSCNYTESTAAIASNPRTRCLREPFTRLLANNGLEL